MQLDKLWELPTEGRFDDPAEEARFLGEMAAAQTNKQLSGIPVGTRERCRLSYAEERMEELHRLYGDSMQAAFSKAYNETIDLSLSADWRELRESITETK